MKRLENKVCIVTGAAHGIGRAIAERFAAEGAWVLLVDVDQPSGEAAVSGIAAAGGLAQFVQTDASVTEQIDKVVKVAKDERGQIDVLVNNAAYFGDGNDVLKAAEEEWDRTYAVNLKGAALFTKAVLPSMLDRKNGSIINIASIQGLVAGRLSVAYTSMKHGLIGLTRSTALDFGPRGIRANAICPGPIRTRISPPDGTPLHQRQVSKTMLARTGEPSEVAWAAVFLASDESSYVTGAVLPVDGGWSAF
jgi:NAD(P)-dependent dehydrogenase (short-subunit alcohol dehydrogenase family)